MVSKPKDVSYLNVPGLYEEPEKRVLSAERNAKVAITNKLHQENEETGIFDNITDLMNGHVKPKPKSKGRVQLELAPNAVIFIESEKYLDGPELHYPQFEVVRDFFELLCPKCNDIERIRTQNDIPREQQVLFEHNICPKCGYDKVAHGSDFRNYNELIGVVGMRGGKSVLVACMSAAIIHELLCVDDLQEKLGLVRAQEIDGAFVASSGEQAAETIYGHFRSFYDNSPWFQNYRKALMDLEITDPALRRGDLYWHTDRSIHFKDKNIKIKSLTSNSGSIAGKTRIFGVIDELARMDAGESKRGAKEIYRALKRSLTTIKASVERLRRKGIYTIPDARMFCISSPMFDDDEAMKLLRQSDKNEKMFAFHRATWEFNPDISKEDLADEFAVDPVGAERDYGANPPGSENPLITNIDIIEMNIDKTRSSNVSIREIFFEDKIGEYKFMYVKPEVIDLKYHNLHEYVIHCDPGQKHDSFCLAIGHRENDMCIIDGAIECKPIHKNNRQGLPPREVYFPALTDIIINFARKITLKYISYDRWNSTEQIHRLRDNKILSFQRNLTRDDHVRFVGSLASNKVRFPNRENELMDPITTRNMPCAKALAELKRLNDNGVKVDHPPGGSNDMIQCYIGVHRLLMFPEQVISMDEMRERNRRNMGARFHSSGGIGKVIKLPPKGSGMRR